MAFWSIAAPILGSIASTALQQGIGRMNRNAANRYNHPTQQIERLREAGISPTMYYNGGGTVTSDVGTPQPNVDQDLGAGKAVDSFYNMKHLGIKERMAKAQIENIETRTQGIATENAIKQKELNRYDMEADRAYKISGNTEVRNQGLYELRQEIDRGNLDIRREANMIAAERLDFDQEKWIVEEQMKQRDMALREAKTREEIIHIQNQIAHDWAMYWIAQGHLDISVSDLERKWNMYKSDYSKWEAINSGFDDEEGLDWPSIINSMTGRSHDGLLERLRQLFR